MILNKLDTGSEIRFVEFVRHVPSKGSEFPPFLSNCMKEGHGVQEYGKVFRPGVVQVILENMEEMLLKILERNLRSREFCTHLSHALIGPFHARTNPLWWLICKLDGGMEETNWESRIAVRCEPNPKIWIDCPCVIEKGHNLITELEAKVTVLKERPRASDHGVRDELLCKLLLPLTQ